MKFVKLNPSRVDRLLAGVLVVTIVACIGVGIATYSHADVTNSPTFNKVKLVNPTSSGPSKNISSNLAPENLTVNQAATSGIVPPQNPSESLAPNPNFTDDGACSFGTYDDSNSCTTNIDQAVSNAHSSLESLPALNVSLGNLEGLTAPEQIFAITNLERTARGLPPIAGLTTQLNGVAQTGANNDTDPSLATSTLSGGAEVINGAAVNAIDTSNPLGSDYYWMYDDGPNSPNGDCAAASDPGCWGHRDAILGNYISSGCTDSNAYMGAAYVPGNGTSQDYSSFSAIIVGACLATPSDIVFTWAQAEQLLAGTVTTPAPSPPPSNPPSSPPAQPGGGSSSNSSGGGSSSNKGSTPSGSNTSTSSEPTSSLPKTPTVSKPVVASPVVANSSQASVELTPTEPTSSDTSIVKVVYLVNGIQVGSVTKAPFYYKINSYKYPNGSYAIQTKTYYSNGTVALKDQALNVKLSSSKRLWHGYGLLLIVVLIIYALVPLIAFEVKTIIRGKKLKHTGP